ncbi:hypothetical protein DFR52_102653 [Hoeflea marina]|uniref:Uncharacterized protein n=1 Tax=Hoeflea marina TaxID=274592 RepID=A0A317PPX7_9HYPH|nr:hypothetical protein [Hoeflea marina]PWW01988.1 hypothetical protein DFR52_102653 [Hoeflea marina]
MNGLIYAGFIAAGAVMLLIEAFRNFNSQTGHHPFELHPILKDVEVRNLCTTGETIAGFAFYAALYLIVYSVVLGSAEIYELVLDASNARTEVGATGGFIFPGSDTPVLSSTEYGKPIFVSAMLISFLSIGAVKPIEATMRSLAHRMAGIPRGVYKVIESLRAIPYERYTTGHSTPFAQKFINKSDKIDPANIYEAQKKYIKQTLIAIDCLSPATTTKNRTLYFPLYRMATLTELSDKLAAELGTLRLAIDEMDKELGREEEGSTNPISSKDVSEIFSELERMSSRACSNTMAVFAVLFVRNNRSIFSTNGPSRQRDLHTPRTPIEATKLFIEQRYNAEQNSFAVSFIISILLSSILIFFVYEQWHIWTAPACPEPTTEECLDKIKYAISQRSRTIEVTIWDTIRSGSVIFVSVFFVLVGREVRIEQQSWQTNWKFYQFPFLRLLAISFFSGISAVIISASVGVINVWWASDFEATQAQIITLFQDSSGFFAMHFGMGIILAFAALVNMDKHDHLSAIGTILISALFSALYFAYVWITIFLTYSGQFQPTPNDALFPESIRDTIVMSSTAFFFLIMFAVMLEVTELGGTIRSYKAKRPPPIEEAVR